MFQKLLLCIFLLSFSNFIFSAVIKGRISDNSSGKELDGSTVYIKELKRGVLSEKDGSYIFKNVPQGIYTIICSYVSYQQIEKKISVRENEVLIVNFKLTQKNTELGEVIIASHSNKSTDASARKIERESGQVMNVLSAKTIESLPDLNVADVMQRISGVSMLKNSSGSNTQVVIRGMPPRYNNAMMNGIAMPSAGSGKSVSFDMFGSELVGRLEVIKALTPDQEGDGIGGTVNMEMKEAPAASFFKIQASTGYNQYYFNHDFLTFDSKSVMKKDFYENRGAEYVPSLTDFSRKNLVIKSKKAIPDLDGSISFGKRFFNDKLGIMVSASAQNKYVASTYNSIGYNNDAYNNVSISQWEHQTYCKDQKRIGGYMKLDYEFNPKHQLTFYNSFFQMNEIRARAVVDTTNEDNRTGPGTGTVHLSNQTITDISNIGTSMLKGKHIFSNSFDLDWTIVYTVANGNSPDYASVALVQTIATPGSNPPTYLNYSNCITRLYQWDIDEDKSAYLNLNYRTTLFKHQFEFKAGGMGRMKFRKNYANEYNFNAAPDNYLYPNPDILTVPISTKNDQQLQGNALNNPGNYRAWEDIQAVYGMVKTNIGKLYILGGARVEFTYMANEHNQMDIQQPLAHARFSYYDLLPSLHLNYKFSEKQNLRASVYQAINRPNYTEVIPYSDIRPGGSSGNPNLQHSFGTCYDLRYEIYPQREEVFTAGLFYKSLQNAIEEFINPGNDSRSLKNVAHCTNYGFELVGIKYFGNFGINTNYTFTHSEINNPKHYNVTDASGAVTTITRNEVRPLVGQSPHLVNVGLTYRNEANGYKCSIAYTMQGKRIINVSDSYGKDIYEKNYHNLGVTIEKSITKKLVILAKASNLLNYPIERVTKDGYFIEKLNNYQSYFIGLKLTI
jgi:hypothetical protein